MEPPISVSIAKYDLWFAGVAVALMAAAGGCAPTASYSDPDWRTENVFHENPVFVPVRDAEFVWETVVDVVDNYFDIHRERPVRPNSAIEGRLDTFPRIGATVLEPWHGDTVTTFERLESTFQTVRRRARIRVTPERGGYAVQVVVLKELADIARPLRGEAAAVFPHPESVSRLTEPVGQSPVPRGWIPLGRDIALEQKIIAEIQQHFGGR